MATTEQAHDVQQAGTHPLDPLTADEVSSAAVERSREVPGAQPGFTLDEVLAAIEAIRSDPRWQEGMRRRGITDFAAASIDPWPPGHQGSADDPARRLIRGLTWVRATEDGNAYARPIDGLLALVDLDRMEVVEVEDHGSVPVPATSAGFTLQPVGFFDGNPGLDLARPDSNGSCHHR